MKKELKRNIILQYLFKYCPWKLIYLFGYIFLKKRLNHYLIHAINKKKVIFIHIPKNAGSSIFKTLYKQNNNIKLDHKPHSFYLMHKQINHPLPSFAITRNPWDRFVSTFYYFKNRIEPQKKTSFHELYLFINQFKTMNDFILEAINEYSIYLFKPNHFWPQYKFITNSQGKISVDYIIKFESLEKDINHLSDTLNLNLDLPHLNASKHNHYSTYYTEKTKNIIGQIYKKDIQLFGYKF